MNSRRGFLRRAGLVLIGAPFLPALRPGVSMAAGASSGRRAAAGRADMIVADRYCMTMGAVAGLRIYGPDERFCDEAAAAAFSEMRRVDRLMSSYDQASPLSRINRAAGREEVAAPPEIAAVLESARAYHAATGGAFDVTVGPLLDLYGFHASPDVGEKGAGRIIPPPDDRAVAAALDAVGFQNVKLDLSRGTVGLAHRSSRIDLGGIGVGLALDRAAAALRSMGVESALINHSGDILALGAPPGSEGWEVGIQDPEDPEGTIASFSLRDRSVSTSGNYENFIGSGGRRIGHIFDPVTGRPPSRYLSVSVMAGSSLSADALSTGFFTGGIALAAAAPSPAGSISAFAVRGEAPAGGGTRTETEYHERVGETPRSGGRGAGRDG